MSGLGESSALQRLAQQTAGPLPSLAHEQRRQEELDWVAEQGWAVALLQLAELRERLEEAGGWLGPPRGSTACSLLLWCLGMSPWDPVALGLPASLFYGVPGPPAAHARWSVAEPGLQLSPALVCEPLLRGRSGPIALLPAQESEAMAWLAGEESGRALESWVGEGDWTERPGFDDCPGPRWIFLQGDRASRDELICALALARPGPCGSGMLSDYLQVLRGESAGLPLPELRASRGVLCFREQLHLLGRSWLGLDIQETRAMVRGLRRGEGGRWERSLLEAAEERGLDGAQQETLRLALHRWTPYLSLYAQDRAQSELHLGFAELHRRASL